MYGVRCRPKREQICQPIIQLRQPRRNNAFLNIDLGRPVFDFAHLCQSLFNPCVLLVSLLLTLAQERAGAFNVVV